jgi:branched-chain amino acid transport system permease protein
MSVAYATASTFSRDQLARAVSSPTAATLAVIGGLVVVQRILWPAPPGVLVQGAIIGGLTALISFGIALIYRANRIVNFAQGDLGALPTTAAVLLLVSVGVPWIVAFSVGLVVAMALGALVQFAVIRRFATAPRLILTVATLGLAQLLVALSLALPSLANDAFPGTFDVQLSAAPYPAPLDVSFEVDPIIFGGNDVIALVTVVVVVLALAAFFRFTRMGIAVRASAESADRAVLLGVPVKRVQLVVWTIAAVLAFLAVFLRAGVVGVPLGEVLGPSILVRALAACVIGRMTNLPLIFLGAVTLGMLEQSVVFETGRSALVAPILFVVVLVVLLLQRRDRASRSEGLSSWQVVTDVKPIPPELARVPEVRWGIRGLMALLALVVVALPVVLSSSQVNLAGVILVFAMVGVSLVVLTGWAGQVSLGAVAFVAIGAAVGGWITSVQGWDLTVALLVAGLVGAAVSLVVGLPALRIRGLLLAVVTLAFAQAVAVYGLSRSDMAWLPTGRIDREPLLGVIPIESEAQYYYFIVACLLLVLSMARRIRRSRVGRVMIGVRENDQGAQAFGVSPVRAKLTAFALSGFIASLAGAVFVHHQHGLGLRSYATEESLAVFTMVVIGGLGSLPGALLGAVYVKGAQYFLPAELSFFVGGIGLLLVLLALPDGLGALLYRGRDALLRQVATRRNIMVPSLFADAASIDKVGLSKERGLAFLREMADRLEQGAPVLVPGMDTGEAMATVMTVERRDLTPPNGELPPDDAPPDAGDSPTEASSNDSPTETSSATEARP